MATDFERKNFEGKSVTAQNFQNSVFFSTLQTLNSEYIYMEYSYPCNIISDHYRILASDCVSEILIISANSMLE